VECLKLRRRYKTFGRKLPQVLWTLPWNISWRWHLYKPEKAPGFFVLFFGNLLETRKSAWKIVFFRKYFTPKVQIELSAAWIKSADATYNILTCRDKSRRDWTIIPTGGSCGFISGRDQLRRSWTIANIFHWNLSHVQFRDLVFTKCFNFMVYLLIFNLFYPRVFFFYRFRWTRSGFWILFAKSP